MKPNNVQNSLAAALGGALAETGSPEKLPLITIPAQ